MAISTYAELQTAVANWLHRSDLTALIPDFILLGEKRLLRDLRCKEMETALSVTIASGVAALPSDYIELKNAYVDGSPTQNLERTSVVDIYHNYPTRSSDKKPTRIAREGSNFIFGPYPDSAYTIKGIYYAYPTTIQTSDNAVFTAHPDIYLWAALIEAEPYILNDPRLPVWEAKYQNSVYNINNIVASEEFSGSGISVRTA